MISLSARSVGLKSKPDRSAFVTVHEARMYVDDRLTALLSAKLNLPPPLNSP
jgi:hypothetical protein